ncbi:MAG: YceI family protein [Planctomycetota bacterium]|nr:YceI family protein [Planctomycetota bacterium]
MNFKLLALGTLALALPLAFQAVAVPASATPVSAAAPWKVDSGHSSVVFRIKHVVAPFWGRFDKVSGAVQWDAAKPETASVELTVDVGSVNTNDGKRDDHLRGPDFFSAKEFPTMTFKSTKVTKKGDGKLEATGDLTLHGVTKSVTVPIEVTGEGESPFKDTRAGFEATFEIKRGDYGVKGYIPTISDEVRIVVALECVKG